MGMTQPGGLEQGALETRWRLIALIGALLVATTVVVGWAIYWRSVNHGLGVFIGATQESGPYYGFWSGFGSDLAEFGIIGVVATGVYQLVKRYNCHQPGCWRVGAHPAAGGQFFLCYRHHPDYRGMKPTRSMIEELHREHKEQLEVIRASRN
jgi:hypothetical protein